MPQDPVWWAPPRWGVHPGHREHWDSPRSGHLVQGYSTPTLTPPLPGTPGCSRRFSRQQPHSLQDLHPALPASCLPSRGSPMAAPQPPQLPLCNNIFTHRECLQEVSSKTTVHQCRSSCHRVTCLTSTYAHQPPALSTKTSRNAGASAQRADKAAAVQGRGQGCGQLPPTAGAS